MTTAMQVFQARAQMDGLEPLGVIDIGSNSVRLVIYEGAVRSPTPVFNEKVLCGLGRGIATTGRLGDDGIARALLALTRFRAIARVLKVKNLRAFATAAVRDAANGPEFIARGEKASGTKIDILSGEKEALLAAQGIRMGFMDPDGMAGDLGGGSLELIDIYKDELNDAATLPLGGLRLIDQTENRPELAVEIADAEIAKLPWLTKGRGRAFYAVGGTWRSLAKLHMEHARYPLRIMQGYAVPRSEMIEFCEMVRRARKVTQLRGIDEVARARREALPYGALVLERLLKYLQPSAVVFSVYGVREGLIYGLLPPAERAKDPLLTFCGEYARIRSRSPAHAHELCEWTDQIFVPPGPLESPAERRLRHAACLLSDIGWRAHPDYRGEQSLDKIAHSALAGIDHPGRIFLALTVYFRHVGPEETATRGLPELLTKIADRRLVRRARILGAALRAAHMVSIGQAGVIDETTLTYAEGKVVLTLPRQYGDLDGERLQRRFESFAELLGLKGEIVRG
ncbi:MAG: Ppx/GppA phosphatase family protein [Hyphomicrobium sp.]|nr:Ppx/GppA phosphatase family protein [Hyphomicrobium sp.]